MCHRAPLSGQSASPTTPKNLEIDLAESVKIEYYLLRQQSIPVPVEGYCDGSVAVGCAISLGDFLRPTSYRSP
jgi:hypothetical protein